MRVEIHDLKHEKWSLEAEPTDSIGDLKSKNSTARGLDESANQKMIYSGKILKDTDTLSSINYAEGKGFIVCMVSKSKKPAAKPAAPAAVKAPETSAPKQESPQQAAGAQPAGQPSSSATDDEILTGPSTLATGSQLNAVVANIVDMGYPQQQVLRAMRQAFNNPDRAVEYLVTGQVEDPGTAQEEDESAERASAEQPQQPPAENTNSEAPERQGSEPQDARGSSIDRDLFDAAEEQEDAEAEEIPDGEDIDFHELLGLDEEQLSQLRAAVQQNPQELLRLLDPLVRSNPQVAETLVNNLDQFMWFLQSSGGSIDDAAIEGGEPGTQTVSISQEEEAAIHRIMELGFNFDTVAMAFIACDRDEQLTANYLLEHGYDE